MSAAAFDNSHYEQACDQAIAMCDGNLRSTIKALIMANEYLEAEARGIAGGNFGRLHSRDVAQQDAEHLQRRVSQRALGADHVRCHLLCRTAFPHR